MANDTGKLQPQRYGHPLTPSVVLVEAEQTEAIRPKWQVRGKTQDLTPASNLATPTSSKWKSQVECT
jgi:hypothetical protein